MLQRPLKLSEKYQSTPKRINKRLQKKRKKKPKPQKAKPSPETPLSLPLPPFPPLFREKACFPRSFCACPASQSRAGLARFFSSPNRPLGDDSGAQPVSEIEGATQSVSRLLLCRELFRGGLRVCGTLCISNFF
ncbi:hypothetical protein CEXT_282131 [Caerostris extrusa]|uniref:Uncharacterized protein n=1 Tax=Caerostris extrusa TaxID=172846 RepID=A0AAV4MX44_CAEEX|nr:hypothetical protein CEXT_282131 [Caerostris extrusa]